MSIENSINVPTLSCCYGHKWLVACLSPRSNVFSSLLESSSQCIGRILIKAMKGIAVHIMPHFGLVDVACSCLLGVPKHLICHLCPGKSLIRQISFMLIWMQQWKERTMFSALLSCKKSMIFQWQGKESGRIEELNNDKCCGLLHALLEEHFKIQRVMDLDPKSNFARQSKANC